MRSLVAFLARSLVDNPDAVEVREVVRDDAVVLELKVDPADVGKVIGRQGRVVRAIRTVARAAGARGGRRVEVDVV
ncbi:MAG: KH domain-containing protein [Bacillota bacterium]|nr:RNA-binding protein [Bacillota bacterium]REJ38102.1 MAG: RNA-binding protein [Bacillota bacterium]